MFNIALTGNLEDITTQMINIGMLEKRLAIYIDGAAFHVGETEARSVDQGEPQEWRAALDGGGVEVG